MIWYLTYIYYHIIIYSLLFLCSFKKIIYSFFYKQSEHYKYTILIVNFLIHQLLFYLLIYFLSDINISSEINKE